MLHERHVEKLLARFPYLLTPALARELRAPAVRDDAPRALTVHGGPRRRPAPARPAARPGPVAAAGPARDVAGDLGVPSARARGRGLRRVAHARAKGVARRRRARALRRGVPARRRLPPGH